MKGAEWCWTAFSACAYTNLQLPNAVEMNACAVNVQCVMYMDNYSRVS